MKMHQSSSSIDMGAEMGHESYTRNTRCLQVQAGLPAGTAGKLETKVLHQKSGGQETMVELRKAPWTIRPALNGIPPPFNRPGAASLRFLKQLDAMDALDALRVDHALALVDPLDSARVRHRAEDVHGHLREGRGLRLRLAAAEPGSRGVPVYGSPKSKIPGMGKRARVYTGILPYRYIPSEIPEPPYLRGTGSSGH